MSDATNKRIEELRIRHVAAVEGGTEGRMMLMRQQHMEHARSEADLRAQGVKLHVVRDFNVTNQCPFYRQPKAIITCLSRSTNHTEAVCFGCPYPMEWATVRNLLLTHDVRTHESQWRPYKMIRYINGVPTPVEYEPYVYMRAEERNGDVWWFKRYLHGQVTPDYSGMMDYSRDTRWWDLGPSDMAPRQSSLPPEEIEAKREAAEKKRSALNKPVKVKGKKKAKRSADSDE